MAASAAVATSLDELLAGAVDRRPMKTADSKSAASFERLTIAGERLVVKVVDGRRDWLAIASGDVAGRAVCLWEDGVYARLPASIDDTVVAAGRLGEHGQRWPIALLMRDASDELVAEDAPVDLATHDAILAAMADLAVAFRTDPPRTTYMPFALTYRFLLPAEAARQLAAGTAGGPQPLITTGWEGVRADAPQLYGAVAPLLDDPNPLAAALLATPTTFVHGDWKLGNLGRRPDGVIVLLDWDRPSIGPPTADLAWYLAVNCDRLPEGKDAAADRYRQHLERRGWGTAGWWDRQLSLALLGAFVQLGWSKAGQDAELGWWEPVVVAGMRRLAQPG